MPTLPSSKTCQFCQTPITSGRRDKIFCSLDCKNKYHLQLRRTTDTNEAVIRIDRILHRNRSIMQELIGSNKTKIKILRLEMDKKKFNYRYFTHTHINKQGKTYHYVYDFGWMAFSDQEILIVKKKARTQKQKPSAGDTTNV